jgi:ORF6N domain
MVVSNEQVAKAEGIESLILTVRGLRVMRDSDLAKVYGVELKRLNEQVRRNVERFPKAFAFQLTPQESVNLQPGYGKPKTHGGRRKLPWVFTEHGALQLASVLNSKVAVEASIRVVQTFILMREQLAAHKELAGKLAELEGRVSGHDSAIQHLFEAIRQLIEPPLPESRPKIGFSVRETSPPYRVKARPRK